MREPLDYNLYEKETGPVAKYRYINKESSEDSLEKYPKGVIAFIVYDVMNFFDQIESKNADMKMAVSLIQASLNRAFVDFLLYLDRAELAEKVFKIFFTDEHFDGSKEFRVANDNWNQITRDYFESEFMFEFKELLELQKKQDETHSRSSRDKK